MMNADGSQEQMIGPGNDTKIVLSARTFDDREKSYKGSQQKSDLLYKTTRTTEENTKNQLGRNDTMNRQQARTVLTINGYLPSTNEDRKTPNRSMNKKSFFII
jgi:hypothetical protein